MKDTRDRPFRGPSWALAEGNHPSGPFSRAFAGALLSGAMVAAGWASAQPPASSPIVPTESQARTRPRGPDSSLTILPVRLAGRPFDRVTEVVGLLLEKQGLRTIELGTTAFEPAPGTDVAGLAAAVGSFVIAHPVTTEYVMYAELNGSRETGLDEVRSVLADSGGTVLWTDVQTRQDDAFKAIGPPEPMTLCVLLAQRLGPQLGLTEETARAAKPGKLAALMEQRSGLPPQDERSPLPERQRRMKESRTKATLVVYPVRLGGAANVESAAAVANALTEEHLFATRPATDELLLRAPRSDPNEMKVLWDLAREFRSHLREHPPEADYALYADYAFSPENWKAGFVHFVVCDRKGDWVIVDMRNSHHPDMQEVRPTSREGCDKLLVKGLESYFR